MKAKRDEPMITIRLKGEPGMPVFHPGETVSGVLEIQPHDVIKCRGVVLTIGWHTQGRGDTDGSIIQQYDYPVTELRPESPLVEQFDCILPANPRSYVGHLIQIAWEIHAKVDIAMARDYNASLQFVLEPPSTS